MLTVSCKRRLFKKLLFLSAVFCAISVLYNGIIYAGLKKNKQNPKDNVSYVKMQQEEIIDSLKKIEDCLPDIKGEKK